MVKKSVLRFKALINAYPKVSILLTATLFFLYRLLFLPGLEFNSKIWDDEVGWEKEFHQKSFLEWITYRDAPGYFVFLPRLILAICHIAPDLIFASSLRIILIILNLVCVYFASKLVIGRDKGPATALLVFGCFSSIYISDLNYLHNIAYYFIFPILFLVQKISKGETKFSLGYLFLMILFINKPIVAILLLILFLYLFLINGFSKKPLWILVFYNIFYLGSYLFLPNRWPTPTNSDLMTLKQVLLNIPWVTGSVLLPAVYFGLNGFLHFLQLDLLRKILGISLYLIPSLLA